MRDRLLGTKFVERKSYQDLIAWQKSIQLVKKIYLSTSKFPPDEKFNLVSQLRRAAVSIPSNIAEGYGRGSLKERHQLIIQSRGSAAEIETQLILARELGFATEADLRDLELLLGEILRMLTGLSKSLH